MKKKIKNLTLKQAKSLCDKYTAQNENGLCNECPYHHDYDCKLDYNNLDEYGDEEVDLEELKKYESN